MAEQPSSSTSGILGSSPEQLATSTGAETPMVQQQLRRASLDPQQQRRIRDGWPGPQLTTGTGTPHQNRNIWMTSQENGMQESNPVNAFPNVNDYWSRALSRSISYSRSIPSELPPNVAPVMNPDNNPSEAPPRSIECGAQVERVMELRRLETSDGRVLGPDEKPPEVSSSDCPTPSERSQSQPSVTVTTQSRHQDGIEVEEKVNAPVTKERSKAVPNVEILPVVEMSLSEVEQEAAELKEKRRAEEMTKAKQAEERKKRAETRAQSRALARAQKEAEKKEKKKERRALQKSAVASSGEPSSVAEASIGVESNPEVEEVIVERKKVRIDPRTRQLIRKQNAEKAALKAAEKIPPARRGRRKPKVLGLPVSSLMGLGALAIAVLVAIATFMSNSASNRIIEQYGVPPSGAPLIIDQYGVPPRGPPLTYRIREQYRVPPRGATLNSPIINQQGVPSVCNCMESQRQPPPRVSPERSPLDDRYGVPPTVAPTVTNPDDRRVRARVDPSGIISYGMPDRPAVAVNPRGGPPSITYPRSTNCRRNRVHEAGDCLLDRRRIRCRHRHGEHWRNKTWELQDKPGVPLM